MTIYSYKAADNLIDRYNDRGGDALVFPGCLCDNYILYGDGLKTTVIKEVYINEYSSGVSIRMYNKTPAKYQKIIDIYDDGNETQAEALFFRG